MDNINKNSNIATCFVSFLLKEYVLCYSSEMITCGILGVDLPGIFFCCSYTSLDLVYVDLINNRIVSLCSCSTGI